MGASENEADVFVGRSEVQRVTHGDIRRVRREVTNVGMQLENR